MVGLLGKAVKTGYWDENQLVGEDGINEVMNALLAECPPEMVLQHNIIIAHHHTANNVAGGGTSAGTFTSLLITRIFQDTESLASLSGSTLTIPAGRWLCRAQHIFRQATAHISRLKLQVSDVGGGNLLELYSDAQRSNTDCNTNPFIEVVIDRAATFELKWQYFVNVAQATNGLGVPGNHSTDEIYGSIRLERVRLVEA